MHASGSTGPTGHVTHIPTTTVYGSFAVEEKDTFLRGDLFVTSIRYSQYFEQHEPKYNNALRII